ILELYMPQAAPVVLQMSLVAFEQPHDLAILHDGVELSRITAQPWPTEITTVPLELPAGDLRLQLLPLGSGIAPRDLGMGDDPRPLTVALRSIAVGAP
ncbi:MAG TPA: hypothetical protein PKC19_21140, partial [Roseiflexaceae bacterium]|nr:hypothetical protein [Roseiflexaceae bacterium]